MVSRSSLIFVLAPGWFPGTRSSFLRQREVPNYRQDQEQHHRRISFQEEFLKLLRNHGVELDERYIGQ